MSTKYFALLTQLGADKLANAAALGTKIEITHMAVGDGGGKLPTPDTKQAKLINEKRRAAINTLSIDPKNTNQIIAEQVIPENEGGWWIREIGLYDKDGVLIAVGNCAETYKPQLQEGSGRTQTIRMILIVSSANAVTLKVDPSVILATREYVDDSIKKHANSRNHPDATLKEKGFVILSSAVDSNSETHAATPKAVKTAYDLAKAADNNANGRVPAGRKVNGKALSADIALNAGDVGAYSKGETDTKVGEAIKQANAANANANTRVPSTRKVNGKALSADIALNAADVGAYNTAQTDAKVGEVRSLANTANQNAANANNNANTRLEKNKNGADIPNKDEFVKNLGLVGTVPNSRRINGKPLTGDVNLNAADVGALKVGDYGIGSQPVGISSPAEYDANSMTTTGWHSGGGYAAKNFYNTHAPIMVMTRTGGSDSTGMVAQIQVDDAGMASRYRLGNRWNKWNTIWGTANTTVIDGFLKKASPIIKIWNDGKFETNDESTGAIVERLSEGVYLIKNVLGFNADAAWGGVDGGVEIPLCKNKLPLIWVNYEVLPDGSIKIMTYHREYSDVPTFARNVRKDYVDGDPIDIPVGRSIFVRVQMPENSIWNQQQRKLTESE